MVVRWTKIKITCIQFLIVASASALVSCQAALKVYVDVFDSSELAKSPAYKDAEIAHYKHLLTTDFSKEGLALFKQKAQRPFVTFINNPKNFGYAINSIIKQTFISALKDSVNTKVNEAHGYYHEALKNLVTFQLNATKKNWDKVEGYVYKGNLCIQELEEVLITLKFRLNNFYPNKEGTKISSEELVKSKVAFDKAVTNVYSETKVTFEKQITSFGHSIASDKLASLVVKAPKKYWRRLKHSESIRYYGDKEQKKSVRPARFNKSIARAFMGNVDVAIKMESPGNYTVKGVRLDADAVLSASARVLSQAVKYIAMTQGVGGLVSSATNTVDGVASSATNVLFDSEILTSKLSNLQREIKQANSQFLSEMMSLEKLLNSNNTNITDNKKKVKVVTENHKLRLQTITEKYK